MLRVNFEFIRLENKLTGLRLSIITSTESFHIEFAWAQKKQIASKQPLKVCFSKNYLPTSDYTETDSVQYFRELVAYLGN